MNQIQQRLDQDHRELDALLWRLSEAAVAPADDALIATWTELEPRLLAHLDAEEEYLLPLVEASHPAQVDCTRSEHEQIRRLVAELGIAIELHSARQPAISELIRVLHEHAEREDRTLYRFAGEKASVAVEHSIVTTLKQVTRLAVLQLPRQSFTRAGVIRAELRRDQNRADTDAEAQAHRLDRGPGGGKTTAADLLRRELGSRVVPSATAARAEETHPPADSAP